MEYIRELNSASLILDAGAAFILLGTVYYTSIYRRRGRIDDKIYYNMLITAIICVFANMAIYACYGTENRALSVVSIICSNISNISFEIICAMMAVYFDYRARKKKEWPKNRYLIFALPMVVEIGLVVVNNFNPFLYRTDMELTILELLPMHRLLFIAPAMYMLSSIISIIKINTSMTIVAGMLFIITAVMGYLMPGVSSTLLYLSVVLVFIHIHVMRFSFYDEEERD